VLKEDVPLRDQGVASGSALHLDLPPSRLVTLVLKSSQGCRTVCLGRNELGRAVRDAARVLFPGCWLSFRGRPVLVGRTLVSLGLKDGSVVTVCQRLCGGSGKRRRNHSFSEDETTFEDETETEEEQEPSVRAKAREQRSLRNKRYYQKLEKRQKGRKRQQKLRSSQKVSSRRTVSVERCATRWAEFALFSGVPAWQAQGSSVHLPRKPTC